MLREAVDWLTTPTLPGTRWSGHLAEFVAIAARRRRHLAAWKPHEARCRAAILRAADRAQADGSALILGAGHANDVPLEDLAARFTRVILVDLAFAAGTRARARRLTTVDCRHHDVTESLRTLPRVAQPGRWSGDPDIRFVASVNLLSQLASVASRHLDDAQADALALGLIEAHLSYLRRFACPVCLIADLEIQVLDKAGRTIATLEPTQGARLPEPDEVWTWDIAPIGEIDRCHAVRHRVAAFDDLTASR